MSKQNFYIVIIIGICIRLFFINGFVFDDTFPYGQQAHHFSNGSFNLNADLYYSMRIAFILPLGFFVGLFGDNNFGYYAWPFLSGIIPIILTMHIARFLFNEKVSLYSGILLAFMPILVNWSSIPTPDSSNLLFYTLFFFFFIKSEFQKKHKRKICFLILSGIFLGIGFYNRIFTPIVLIIVPIMMIYRKKIILDYLWGAVGIFISFIIGNGIYFLGSGDFFLRYNNTSIKKSWIASDGIWIEKPATFDYFSDGIFNYTLNLFHPSYWPSWGILFFFVFISILYLIMSFDRKKYSIILIWFFSILLGTEILNSITSLHNWQPYIAGIAAPASIIVALFIDKFPAAPIINFFRKKSFYIYALHLVLAITLFTLIVLSFQFQIFSENELRMRAYIFLTVLITTTLLWFQLLAVHFFSKNELIRTSFKVNILTIIISTSLIMTFGENQRLKKNILPYKKVISLIDKHSIKNIYYMTYKSRVRLIPELKFATSYWYKMPYESWSANVGSSIVNFEFLPLNINEIKKGDGIIIDKERLNAFKINGLNTSPFYSKTYKFPDYIKNDQPTWEIILDQKDIIFYKVN